MRATQVFRLMCSVVLVGLGSLIEGGLVGADAEVSFFARRDVRAGTSPAAATVSDFNADGRLDLAVTNFFSTTVSILLGQDDGTFQAPQDFAVGDTPNSVTVGDFNADGRPDLAVANQLSHTVSILLGQGDGTFQAAQDVAVSDFPGSVTVGDFNADGRPDLVTVSESVSILRGQGDGTFTRAPDVGVGGVAITVGDFNADGHQDLATNGGVLLGNGDGTFQRKAGAVVGGEAITVGDFNADGRLDLATATAESAIVSVLLGQGDGTFLPVRDVAVDNFPVSVMVGDFNADGRPDLATANARADTVSILLGQGDGTFQATLDFAVGVEPGSVTVGDFNADGHLDLATANDGGTVSILLGESDGTFQAAQDFGVGTIPIFVTVGDFNGDDRPDLATGNLGPTVSILLGQGDGTFQAAQDFVIGANPFALTVGDFNGDGRPDLATANATSNTVSILLGQGDGTFQATQDFDFGVGSGPFALTVGDFNGDGRPDLATANARSNTVSILINLGAIERPREVIDFEGIPAGTVVTEVFADGGFGPITVTGRRGKTCPHNAAVVFGSRCPTGICSGDDQDLGTPNNTFGGPGAGKGGVVGSPWANDMPLGNLLIVHEECNELADQFVENPDDTARASTITLKFPQPVRVFRYTIIDNERDERDEVQLFGEQGERLATLTGPATGNNGKAVVQTTSNDTGIGGVIRMVFERNSSGGIDNIVILPEASVSSQKGPLSTNRVTRGKVALEDL